MKLFLQNGRRIRILGATLLCGFITACGPQSGSTLDATDENDAHVRQGLELVQQKDWDAAIQQFKIALEKKPQLGRPDLELAQIYHQQKKNYVRAIYHYECYLEKRPQTEKRVLIQNWIQQAKVSLAGEVGTADNTISEQLVRLTRENNLLRKQLADAGGGTAAPVVNIKTILDEPPATRPEPVIKPSPATPPPVVAAAPPPERTYTVRRGDTLMRISGQFYGNPSNWRTIYEANRQNMKSESDLKIGQILIIPDL